MNRLLLAPILLFVVVVAYTRVFERHSGHQGLHPCFQAFGVKFVDQGLDPVHHFLRCIGAVSRKVKAKPVPCLRPVLNGHSHLRDSKLDDFDEVVVDERLQMEAQGMACRNTGGIHLRGEVDEPCGTSAHVGAGFLLRPWLPGVEYGAGPMHFRAHIAREVIQFQSFCQGSDEQFPFSRVVRLGEGIQEFESSGPVSFRTTKD